LITKRLKFPTQKGSKIFIDKLHIKLDRNLHDDVLLVVHDIYLANIHQTNLTEKYQRIVNKDLENLTKLGRF